MSPAVHPNQALFGGEKPFPVIPSCEHFAGSEKLILKALALQDTVGPIFDITCDCEDGAAEKNPFPLSPAASISRAAKNSSSRHSHCRTRSARFSISLAIAKTARRRKTLSRYPQLRAFRGQRKTHPQGTRTAGHGRPDFRYHLRLRRRRGGEKPFPVIPSCEHFAGSEKLILKA